MKNYAENSKLITIVIAIFSMAVTLFVFAPIFMSLNSLFAVCLLSLIVFTIWLIMSARITTLVNEYIVKCIKKQKKRHVQEFFNYIESDKQFAKNILRRDVPILNDDNKEIGTQTIYTALGDKKWGYFGTIEE
jgi:ABC-type bacteriocin/lantibiotic exporter with double-glycine peptidase domain